MNAVFYGFQFAHHGKHSAFLALKKVLEKNRIHVVTALRPQILWRRGLKRLLPLWMKIQERRLYCFFKCDSTNVVHYFFPENSLFHAPKWKGRKKLILTCHQPVREEFFDPLAKRRKYFIDGVKCADVIILMASNDIHSYQEFAPQAKVICIPHGVDTSFFARDDMSYRDVKKNERKRILTVGDWLRDYKYWADVVKKILLTRNDIDFTVVAGNVVQEEIRCLFKQSLPHRIKLLSGISDEELRDAYQKSDLLFLPLIDAWANNALLEASSMGIPIMATSLPAVREYIGENIATYFTNESAEATADQLSDILADKDGLVKKGRALRRRMENEFSWEKIVERHLSLYKMLDSPDWPDNFK